MKKNAEICGFLFSTMNNFHPPPPLLASHAHGPEAGRGSRNVEPQEPLEALLKRYRNIIWAFVGQQKSDKASGQI